MKILESLRLLNFEGKELRFYMLHHSNPVLARLLLIILTFAFIFKFIFEKIPIRTKNIHFFNDKNELK